MDTQTDGLDPTQFEALKDSLKSWTLDTHRLHGEKTHTFRTARCFLFSRNGAVMRTCWGKSIDRFFIDCNLLGSMGRPSWSLPFTVDALNLLKMAMSIAISVHHTESWVMSYWLKQTQSWRFLQFPPFRQTCDEAIEDVARLPMTSIPSTSPRVQVCQGTLIFQQQFYSSRIQTTITSGSFLLNDHEWSIYFFWEGQLQPPFSRHLFTGLGADRLPSHQLCLYQPSRRFRWRTREP